ncbi:uncharacterized protein F4822DRAFT_134107 [Hypoxylon trugodes]|uniref:uncharacterized protein n=1 Tax=Hypoxylon trugodes TaxID=326681 RepID=UPI00218E4BAA|nr:uncharacterized protein F4822DRAFT_134107 [Hypoxylon trugodes]KAI1392615.1 hypothetical protein F4822DRAFT_134107 [Hypoxylon trugodes]
MADEAWKDSHQFLKLSVIHWRVPGVSEEDYQNWIHKTIIPPMMRLVEKHNIVHYSVTSTPSSLHPEWNAMIAGLGRGPAWKVVDCDMIVNYWLRSSDDLKALATDPDYPKITATEKDFSDKDHAEIIVGYETLYLVNGKVVNTVATDI